MHAILSRGSGDVGQTQRENCECFGDVNDPGTSSMAATASEPGAGVSKAALYCNPSQ